jgi:hypothetical protein
MPILYLRSIPHPRWFRVSPRHKILPRYRVDKRVPRTSTVLAVVTFLLGGRMRDMGQILLNPGMIIRAINCEGLWIYPDGWIDLGNNEVKPDIGTNRHGCGRGGLRSA